MFSHLTHRGKLTLIFHLQTGMAPEQAGAFIARVATRKGVRPVNTIGLQYKFFCFLAKVLPARWLNALVGLIYAK